MCKKVNLIYEMKVLFLNKVNCIVLMIFETKRLSVRKLSLDDAQAFHTMQSNPKVMQFADGKLKNFDENTDELKELINSYSMVNNDFWIYAIVKKSDHQFVGTVALVKDANNDDEIGYRFLEIFWKLGYGSEICNGLVSHCKNIGLKKIIAYVVDENIASVKIVEKNNFKILKKFVNQDLQLLESKYQLNIVSA